MRTLKIFLLTILFTVAINAQSYQTVAIPDSGDTLSQSIILEGQWITGAFISDTNWDSTTVSFQKFNTVDKLWYDVVNKADTSITVTADSSQGGFYFFTADESRSLTGTIRWVSSVVTSDTSRTIVFELTTVQP